MDSKPLIGVQVSSGGQNAARSRSRWLVAASLALAVALGTVLATGRETSPPTTDAGSLEGGMLVARTNTNLVGHDGPGGAADLVRVSSTPTVGIEGQIVWHDGLPAIAANVSLPGSASQALTDANGRYHLPAENVGDVGETGIDLALSVAAPCWVGDPFAAIVRLLPAGVGAQLHASTCSLPDRIDLRVRVDTTPEMSAFLKADRITQMRVVVTNAQVEFFPPVIGSCWVEPAVGETVAILRVPCVPSIRLGAYLDQQGAKSTRHYLPAGDVLPITRSAPADYAVSLNAGEVLAGRVVDHEGNPLARAKVELSVPSEVTATGWDTDIVHSGDDGAFRHYSAAGVSKRVVAHHVGASSTPQNVIVGDHDCRLPIDLREHRRLRLVHGTEPVTEYDCGRFVLLFGRQEEPVLTKRPDGRCWLPKRADDEQLFVTWRHDGLHERQLPLGEAASSGDLPVDVAILPEVELGTVEVIGLETLPHHTVQITLKEPLSTLPKSHSIASFNETRRPRFLGVPRARYEFSIRLPQPPDFKVLASVEMELGGKDTIIDARSYVSR